MNFKQLKPMNNSESFDQELEDLFDFGLKDGEPGLSFETFERFMIRSVQAPVVTSFGNLGFSWPGGAAHGDDTKPGLAWRGEELDKR